MFVTIAGRNGERPPSILGSSLAGTTIRLSVTALATLLVFIAPSGFGQAPPPNTVSLYRVWSSELQDNMTVSLTPTLSENLQRRPRGFPDKYADQTIEGFIFSPDPKNPPPKGTVSLIEWFSPSRSDSMTQAWRGASQPDQTVQIQPDYTLPVLLGYVLDPSLPQPKGTVPLFRWWSPSRKDNHTTTMPAWRGGYREWRNRTMPIRNSKAMCIHRRAWLRHPRRRRLQIGTSRSG